MACAEYGARLYRALQNFSTFEARRTFQGAPGLDYFNG
jgi:hypothetical protein